jgi:hypothetical protein
LETDGEICKKRKNGKKSAARHLAGREYDAVSHV